MEKRSFKKLFLRQIFLISLLILGSAAFHTDFNSEEEYENVKILITADSGLQFSKENSPAGRKIIYDCDLGLNLSGEIQIFDRIHPYDMKSLIIKNCVDLTIAAKRPDYYDDTLAYQLQEVKISNVTSLKFITNCERCISFTVPHFEVSIKNVPFMHMNKFLNTGRSQSVSLKLENVVIDTLENLFYSSIDPKVFNLHLKNVKVNKTEPRAFYLEKDSEFILTIEDSDFKNVHKNTFDFKGEVNITNNTFSFLDDGAFSINTTSPFIFSGNHVKKMLNPFNISADEVNIINNTFDSITTPWLSTILSPGTTSFRVLNIADNFINHWTHNLFYLDSLNSMDIINFEGNYLYCSCNNALPKYQNYITEVFLNKERNNFCHNFGNCPLHKALVLRSKICSGTFQCPEDQNEDDEGAESASHLKSILAVLKNIDTKLDQIVSKYNSLVPDKSN